LSGVSRLEQRYPNFWALVLAIHFPFSVLLNFVIGVEFFGIARGIYASSGMRGSLLVVPQEGCITAVELCVAFSDDKERNSMEFCIS